MTDSKKVKETVGLNQLWVFIKPYRGRMLMAFVVLVIAAGAALAVPLSIKQIVDHGFLANRQPEANLYFLIILATVTVMAVFSSLRYYLVMWLGERIIADIRMALYRHVLDMDPLFYETTPTGEVLSRLTADTTLVQAVVGAGLSMALRNSIQLIGCAVMLALTSLQLTGLVVLAIPLMLGPALIYGRRVRHLSKQNQDNLASSNALAGETLNAISLIQAYTLQDHNSGQYNQTIDYYLTTARRRLKARGVLWGLTLFIVFAAVIGIIWVGMQQVIAGRMTAGELTQFMIYATLAAACTSALSEVWGDVQRAAGALERIFGLLNRRSGLTRPDSPLPIESARAGYIQMNQVSFHYPSRPEHKALDGFSLELAPGERVALVGPSGAGKSTVMQLLLRFYDPQAGMIAFGGVNIAKTGLDELRSLIGVVPQETVIFAASVRDNIRLGNLAAADADVERAANAAAAGEFIRRLPEGYDTFLGERGVRLSGGQRQRIAIARAILKNAPVLLLDEATSALDTESEQLVQQALNQLMRNRTTLIIAHRLATVIKADRIAVMEHGRIIAVGKHEELLSSCDLYARLAKAQFDLE